MRRISLPAATIFSSVLAVLVLGIAAFAQPAVVIPAAGDVTDLLDRGRQMEGERRWGEALTYYEDAMRQFPGDGSVKSHFTTARLHYDLGRRYNDRSFRDLLDGISAKDCAGSVQRGAVEDPDALRRWPAVEGTRRFRHRRVGSGDERAPLP